MQENKIVGKVIAIPGIQIGVSKVSGKEWKLKTFVVETIEQYPRKVAIEIFGEDRIKNYPVELDQTVTASVDIESREANGRWFTSVKAWKVEQGDTTAENKPVESTNTEKQGNVPPETQKSPETEVFDPTPEGGNSDLPF